MVGSGRVGSTVNIGRVKWDQWSVRAECRQSSGRVDGRVRSGRLRSKVDLGWVESGLYSGWVDCQHRSKVVTVRSGSMVGSCLFDGRHRSSPVGSTELEGRIWSGKVEGDFFSDQLGSRSVKFKST